MSVFLRPLISLATAVDRTIGWDRLPRPLGVITLLGLRGRLRERNLFMCTEGPPDETQPKPRQLWVRTIDGTWNDVDEAAAAMGSRGTRFGRNVPDHTIGREELPGKPNPRLISRELLTRHQFIPAWTLNVLAAAWIQFEVHDWFSHRLQEDGKRHEVPLPDGDTWHENPMTIERVERDTTAGDCPPTFRSDDTHWWDGSQIYGNTTKFASIVRDDGGGLRLDEDRLPPSDLIDRYIKDSRAGGNFWVGLGLLHTLFMREHNAICDRLKAEYPSLSDDQLYQKARLVNAAVMAKIHTVEWTPAVIGHKTTELGMRAVWNGLVGRRVARIVDPFHRSDTLSGTPGSPTNHFGVAYSITEEFVGVYRMHPLLPDTFEFRSVDDDAPLRTLEFPDVGAQATHPLLADLGVENAFYSLGIAPPGAITLHNFPFHLQNLIRKRNGKEDRIDLATVDIVRIRESGIPRYREFRELFHRKPVKRFEDVTRDPVVLCELRSVYEDLDQLDLMIGLFAEPLPKGFAFSDTTFRVFLLMASRRLKSDRFFTVDYTPEVYTPAGLRWIDEASMVKILLRHYPRLAPVLCGVDNAFKPWPRVRRRRTDG